MKATKGSKVKVEFTGHLEDGTVFGESKGDQPLDFVVGQSEVIPGFEEAVLGMEPGESKEVVVPPEKGFGAFDSGKVTTLDRGQLENDEQVGPGMQLNVRDQQGAVHSARVDSVTDSTVTLDFNHPLAGQTLKFNIHMVEVQAHGG